MEETPAKTGRPPVGTNINLVVENWQLDQSQQIADDTRQTRAAVLRQTIGRGLPELVKASAMETSTEFVKPAADLIAAWIGQPDTPEERRERFIRWHRVAGHPEKGVNVLMEAAGALVQAGQTPAALPPLLLERLAARGAWRVRAQWHFATTATLQERGVTVTGGELPQQEFDEAEPDGDA